MQEQQKQSRYQQNSVVPLPQIVSGKLFKTIVKMSNCTKAKPKLNIQPITFKPKPKFVQVKPIEVKQYIYESMSIFKFTDFTELSSTVETEPNQSQQLIKRKRNKILELRDKLEAENNYLKDAVKTVERLLLSSNDQFNEMIQINSEQVMQIVELKGE
ncbi:Hypothetical_protein [Hexamita inflata]|uniref:Hypothetical_protein n=1 Tax=Hexamita inflata TaxID=28002 RepID=A0AA86VKZ1_9EUKA|nr:Hypothetical protein HINF_LOCUS57303 [Hexamita inflata]